jgi:hypothetical protein
LEALLSTYLTKGLGMRTRPHLFAYPTKPPSPSRLGPLVVLGTPTPALHLMHEQLPNWHRRSCAKIIIVPITSRNKQL